MWRRDSALAGPEQPTLADVDQLNRIFSTAFSDRYRRDGMPGVRVPHLDPDIWRFALETAGRGAMVWRDRTGEIVAFNLAHLSGELDGAFEERTGRRDQTANDVKLPAANQDASLQAAIRLEEIYRTVRKDPARAEAVVRRIKDLYPDAPELRHLGP